MSARKVSFSDEKRWEGLAFPGYVRDRLQIGGCGLCDKGTDFSFFGVCVRTIRLFFFFLAKVICWIDRNPSSRGIAMPNTLRQILARLSARCCSGGVCMLTSCLFSAVYLRGFLVAERNNAEFS
jgi:hypothetical protein